MDTGKVCWEQQLYIKSNLNFCPNEWDIHNKAFRRLNEGGNMGISITGGKHGLAVAHVLTRLRDSSARNSIP